jgi:hypothetical protein
MPLCFGVFSGRLPAILALGIAVSSAFCQESKPAAKTLAFDSLPESPIAQPVVNSRPASGTTGHVADSIAPATGADASGSAALGDAKIGGTVTDTNGDVVPGATITLDGPSGRDHRTTTADDNAGFEFNNLIPEVPYHLTVSAKGFADWKSSELLLRSGDFKFVDGIELAILGGVTTVTVSGSQAEIATQQVYVEEHQRVLGFIPNFYVVYDAKDAVPMTTKLKFQMAFRTSIDPVTIAGTAFLAGINQAADTPDYPQGAKGYGERFGAVYTDGLTDTMFGGAVLPSLLHQDPRYFYQGTGTIKSRMLHALASPFVCKGDNGKLQPNYSSIGGDLISASISNAYYPASSRGLSNTFEDLGINTAEREASTVIQEFIVRKFTPSAKRQN